ncbi:ParB-like nuclease domain [Streptomyces phage Enygma]
MPKVNVEKLWHDAIFGDASDSRTGGYGSRYMDDKEKCMLDKFDELPRAFIESIEKDGIKTPIVYSPERNRVTNGHHRLLVAYLLGITEIEYIHPDETNNGWELEREAAKKGLPMGRR